MIKLKNQIAMNDELNQKIERAIALLRENEPEDGNGYLLAFSGGKDSCVIKQLCVEAGVKFKSFYEATTIDAPQLIYFLKKHHADTEWIRQPLPFFLRMVEKGTPPTRMVRWCCGEYKEKDIKGFSAKIVGVRSAESVRRSKIWKEVIPDFVGKNKKIVSPIVDWEEKDVWDFIRDRKLPYCELYDKGFKRIGCVGCPLTGAKKIAKEFKAFPNFEKAWRNAFRKMWEKHHERITRNGNLHFSSKYKNGDEWFEHWMSQMSFGQFKLEQCQGELLFT